MSNVFEYIGNAYEKTKDFIEEHPWQAAAITAWPLAGAAAGIGVAAVEAAAALPVVTLGETATAVAAGAAIEGAAVGVGISAGVTIAEGAALGGIGLGLLAVERGTKLTTAESTTRPAEAAPSPTTRPSGNMQPTTKGS